MAEFTANQRAFIRQIVFEASPHILEQHVESCPWGKKMMRAMWFALGIAIGSGVLGFSAGKWLL